MVPIEPTSPASAMRRLNAQEVNWLGAVIAVYHGLVWFAGRDGHVERAEHQRGGLS
jgi:hypothetical protein